MLSIIIPCYNEAKNLPSLVDRCSSLLSNQNIEIIFVDNGSTDETSAILHQLLQEYETFKVIRVEINQGYGHGILYGLNRAGGDILAWTHADMQTDPRDILVGLNIFRNQNEDCLVKGLRYGRPFSDRVFTFGMSIFETFLMGKIMYDINAQPNIFSRNFFLTWDNPPIDFSLDLYVYYQAKKQGISIYRFPVLFAKRLHGLSHWNINWKSKWKFILRTVIFSLKLRKKVN